jgi:acetolactate synthase-1/3 small subunit
MSFSSKQGDVYPVESYESFSANQILDAHWGVITDNDVSSCILFTLN